MGHNRGGDNAKRKKRRRLKQERRLLARAEPTAPAMPEKKPEAPSLLGKVKDLAKSAAHAVGDLVKTGVEKVKGAPE